MLHAHGAWGLSCTRCMVTLMHLVCEISHAPKKYNDTLSYLLGVWGLSCTGCMTGLMHRVVGALHNRNICFGHCIFKRSYLPEVHLKCKQIMVKTLEHSLHKTSGFDWMIHCSYFGCIIEWICRSPVIYCLARVVLCFSFQCRLSVCVKCFVTFSKDKLLMCLIMTPDKLSKPFWNLGNNLIVWQFDSFKV